MLGCTWGLHRGCVLCSLGRESVSLPASLYSWSFLDFSLHIPSSSVPGWVTCLYFFLMTNYLSIFQRAYLGCNFMFIHVSAQATSFLDISSENVDPCHFGSPTSAFAQCQVHNRDTQCSCVRIVSDANFSVDME